MQQGAFKDRDEVFIAEYEEQLLAFFESDEKMMHLSPMNSYYRRLVHHLALEFNFDTHSEGEEADRHVVVAKKKGSHIPKRLEHQKPKVFDFGEQEFLVDPLQPEVEIFLGKDGSLGIYDESANIPYVTKKKVVSGVFKVKNNKIVELHDEEW